MASQSPAVDLLIVGAGPSGLMAACWAAKYNISVRVIDQKPGRTPTGHADGLQSRTLEILDSFGLVEPILKQGVADVESCYWGPTRSESTGNIQRFERTASNDVEKSRFGKFLLNQGAIEQILLDFLKEQQNFSIEMRTKAESLHVTSDDNEAFPVSVGARHTVQGEKGEPETIETINARYLLACDGARSWVRNELGVLFEGHSEDSTWGVLDIIPITNFPDIRQSCAIQSTHHGSIMTVPREKELVRFYIQLGKQEEEAIQSTKDLAQMLVEVAEKAMKPYSLKHEICDWCSSYTVGRRLAKTYRPHDRRIFLIGDAAHTHSPMGGQGMNVSIQDSYNLGWKIGAVLTGQMDPHILSTYENERRPVAEKLLTLDTQLVQEYEYEGTKDPRYISQARDSYAGFMSGVDVKYEGSVLVGNGTEDGGASSLAKYIDLGRRIPSVSLVYQCDGTKEHLGRRLSSDGSWRLLVFPGDLRREERMNPLNAFAHVFTDLFQMKPRQRQKLSAKHHCIVAEPILIHSSPRSEIDLLGLPDIFHPFDERSGWDYWKVFAEDEKDPAYQKYGIDREGPCCLVLCRPDHHVAWVGSMDDVDGLKSFILNIWP